MAQRFTVVRIGLGTLLLAAAGLKLYGLSVSAVPQVGWFAQPWVQLAAVEWELVLGLWLLSGAHQRGAWLAALVTFLAFAAVSGYLGFIGVASCGCFGAIEASPWAAFGFDLAALALLLANRPATAMTRSDLRQAFAVVTTGMAVPLLAVVSFTSVVYGSPKIAYARLRGETLVVAPYSDAGKGKAGEALLVELPIFNASDEVVRVVGMPSDCSCLVLSELPFEIPPHRSATFSLRVRVPERSSGRVTRTVQLWTDCPTQRVLRLQLGYRVD